MPENNDNITRQEIEQTTQLPIIEELESDVQEFIEAEQNIQEAVDEEENSQEIEQLPDSTTSCSQIKMLKSELKASSTTEPWPLNLMNYRHQH